jgi:hypothetical protein
MGIISTTSNTGKSYQVSIVDPDNLYTKFDEPKCAHGVGFHIENSKLTLTRYNQGLEDGRRKTIGKFGVTSSEVYYIAG